MVLSGTAPSSHLDFDLYPPDPRFLLRHAMAALGSLSNKSFEGRIDLHETVEPPARFWHVIASTFTARFSRCESCWLKMT